MIKNFIQKHKTILLAVVITAVATSAVASGYFVVKNEKEKANQKVESLQKSIEELQAKTENSVKSEEDQEANKEPEKDIPAPEATTQQTPTIKKNVEVAPTKVEEKLVSCVAFDGTTLKVSEDECDEIKQKNVIAERVMDKYDDCLSESKEMFQDQLDGGGYQASWVEEYNSNIAECADERNAQLKKLK